MRVESVKLYQPAIAKTTNKVAKNFVNNTVLMSTAAASALAAAAMIKTPEISVKGIENKLLERGYTKDTEGNLSRTLTDSQLNSIQKTYGNYAYDMAELYKKPVSKDDINNFKDFININKQKGVKLYNENFDRLFDTFLILKKNFAVYQKVKEDENIYKMITNLIETNPDENGMNTIYDWKGKSHMGIAKSALTSLREQDKNQDYKIDSETQKYIDNLSKYIDTQNLPEDLKLYRGEGFEVLNNIKLQNGENVKLGDMLQSVESPEDIEKIKEFVLDNELSVVQPGFMATSVDKELSQSFIRPGRGIMWTLEPENSNTKGLFIEGINPTGYCGHEQEVLLQKNSKIKIENIDYDSRKRIWNINAKVSN